MGRDHVRPAHRQGSARGFPRRRLLRRLLLRRRPRLGQGLGGQHPLQRVPLDQFQEFYNRADTFSLGICNGCQLMALLGFVPAEGGLGATVDVEQPRFIHNDSGRFESRWTTVGIEENTPAVMLQGMQGSRIGIWVAHGEGKVKFPDESRVPDILKSGQACVRYVDHAGEPTTQYPLNPNGSPHGIAGLCDATGRHLAMMPHPERAYLGWQMQMGPAEAGIAPDGPGPWMRMFQTRGSGPRAARGSSARSEATGAREEGVGRVHLDFRLAWKTCVYSEQPETTVMKRTDSSSASRQRICGSALEKETPPRLRPRAVAGLSTDVPVLFSPPATLPLPGRALLNVKPVPPVPPPPGRSTSSSSAAEAKLRAASRPPIPPPPVAGEPLHRGGVLLIEPRVGRGRRRSRSRRRRLEHVVDGVGVGAVRVGRVVVVERGHARAARPRRRARAPAPRPRSRPPRARRCAPSWIGVPCRSRRKTTSPPPRRSTPGRQTPTETRTETTARGAARANRPPCLPSRGRRRARRRPRRLSRVRRPRRRPRRLKIRRGFCDPPAGCVATSAAALCSSARALARNARRISSSLRAFRLSSSSRASSGIPSSDPHSDPPPRTLSPSRSPPPPPPPPPSTP